MLKPPLNATSVEAEQGTLMLWRPRPHIFYCKMVGHMGDRHWRAVTQFCDEVIQDGHRLISFLDWQEMTGYDAEARTELTLWSLANKKNVEMAHILVRHKAVALGVSVAGALVRNLKAFTDVHDFEAALADAEKRSATATQ